MHQVKHDKSLVEYHSLSDISTDKYSRGEGFELVKLLQRHISDNVGEAICEANLNNDDIGLLGLLKSVFYRYPTAIFCGLLDAIIERYNIGSNNTQKKAELDAHIEEVLKGKNIYTEYSRNRNISIVNSYQNKILKQNEFSIEQHLCDPKNRSLILYYRGTQMDIASCELAQSIIALLKKYVEDGYSRVFNKFYIVYRYNKDDFLPEFIENSVFPRNDTFEIFTSLYANTIHLSDGTPNFLPGTLNILTNNPVARWNKNYGLDLNDEQYVQLPLSFINKEKSPIPKDEFDNNLNNAFAVTITTIDRCEKRLLKQARDFHKKK